VAGGGIDFHDADDLFYPNSQLNFDAAFSKGRGDDNHGAKGQFVTVCSIGLPLGNIVPFWWRLP